MMLVQLVCFAESRSEFHAPQNCSRHQWMDGGAPSNQTQYGSSYTSSSMTMRVQSSVILGIIDGQQLLLLLLEHPGRYARWFDTERLQWIGEWTKQSHQVDRMPRARRPMVAAATDEQWTLCYAPRLEIVLYSLGVSILIVGYLNETCFIFIFAAHYLRYSR